MRGGAFAAAAAAALLLAAAPAAAVGFGPLVATGAIDGPREGFRFDLLNPYAVNTAFRVYAVGWDDEGAQPRVAVFPATAIVPAQRTRNVLVIADDLAVGETYRFRVCAERADPAEGTMIHARVCSKVTARRVD